MSRRANATIIGLFIIGAAILAVAAALLFGSGMLRDKSRFVMFFDSSVKGLNIGAPVNFRGVKIGSVTDIRLLLDPETLRVQIPVYVDLEPDRILLVSGEEMTLMKMHKMSNMIDQGLRAQLQMQSLLTGQLAIQLDMYADKPVRLVDAVSQHTEIPTIPTPMQEITRKLEDFPVDKVLSDLASAIEGFERLANNPDLAQAIQSFDQAFRRYDSLADDYSTLAGQLDRHAGQISGDLNVTMKQLRSTLSSTHKLIESGEILINDSGELIMQLRDNAERLTASAEGALGEMQTTAGAAGATVSADSQLFYQLTKTLQEVASTARTIRVLANTLEQRPEALLKGKSRAGD